MLYFFVTPAGIVAKRMEADVPPPTVAPSKGRWLGVVEGEKPTFNSETHELRSATEVIGDEYHVTWQRFPIEPERLKEIRKARKFVEDEQNLLGSTELQDLLAESPNEVEVRLRNATIPDLAAEVKRLAKIVNILIRQQYGNR